MSYEYRIEAPDGLSESDLEGIREWFAGVRDAAVHTDDSATWYLFKDVNERKRRLSQWRMNPSRNDYLTSFIVVREDGATLSLVEDDADRVAVNFATWWLDTIGGRLLDSGVPITPSDLVEDW